jgi:predicted acyltransferase
VFAGEGLLSATRLQSLDIYRGAAVAGMILVDNPGNDEAAYWPIKHAVWNGWTPADLLFPSFLFIVGVSLVLSISARRERGESRGHIFRHAVKRALILIAIGLFVNAFPIFDVGTWRIEGVLQRIAVCYLAAVALFLWTNARGQALTAAACLVGYWLLVRFVPVPGYGLPGRDVPFLHPDGNIVAWLDRTLFPGRLYDGTRDPEGLISNIPAVATCLAGVLTGHWLCSPRSVRAKTIGMLLAGTLLIASGEILHRWFPINKKMWTSSFVLLTAGFALLFLALLYWAVEIRRWRGRWTMLFLVFGMNAIAGYLADAVVYGPAYSFHTHCRGGRHSNHLAAVCLRALDSLAGQPRWFFTDLLNCGRCVLVAALDTLSKENFSQALKKLYAAFFSP